MQDMLKPKRSPRRRAMAAANAPEPMEMASCGHSGCQERCLVQYVGPTSSIHAHHALHAAQGITHVWSAAIVSGLAVVLTGVIAYSSTQPHSVEAAAPRAPLATRDDVAALNDRLDHIEQAMQDLRAQCSPPSASTSTASTGDANGANDPSATDQSTGDLVP